MNEGPSFVRFGVFELDVRTGELRRKGVKIPLQEQPFRVLTMLLERPGELVTREQLRTRLWAEAVFVDYDHGLNKAVAKIREALGDVAESPRFVETLERRGYRFIAPTELAAETLKARQSVQSPLLIARLVWDDRSIPLAVGTHLLGRDPGCGIWIAASAVSRRHARLVVSETSLLLEDLGSHNGTFVNGERIAASRRLAHGDEIRVGRVRLIVDLPSSESPTATALG